MSRYENIHAVMQLREGDRMTFAIWFTKFKDYCGDLRAGRSLIGTAFERYMDFEGGKKLTTSPSRRKVR